MIKKIMILNVFLTLVFSSCFTSVFASNISSHFSLFSKQSSISKDKIVGNIVKNALENYHYNRLHIDDKLSKKAFKEYLKRIDFGKQFFYQSDIKKLKKYENKIDDFMLSGNYPIVKDTQDIIIKRIHTIQKFVAKILKKKFNFNKKESMPIDSKKIKYAKNERTLKERWRKIIKNSVLTRYIVNLDTQNDNIKDGKKAAKLTKKSHDKYNKNKNKNKKIKVLTNKALMAKSYKSVSKKYMNYFKRLLKEKHSDFMENLYNSVASIYDPHTVYMPPKKKEDFDIDISGSLEGIGAVLSEDGPYIKVVSIVPGGAAWRAKELKVGDKIVAVSQGDSDPVDLVDMRVDDAVRYIRGKRGTEVRLTLKRSDGSLKIIKIIRDIVEIEASFAKSSLLINKTNGKKIGYIELPKFYRAFDNASKNCSDDVKKEILYLKKLGVEGIIFDLRNNGGGALEDARIISGFFVKDGPIVQVKSHNGNINILKDNDGKILFDKPLIILTNRFSASASEIFAAAMQDYKRAIIIGPKYTHGKGTVQALLDLSRGPLMSLFSHGIGALKVTIQKFYRINGGSTQFKGVTPDLFVPDLYGYMKSREKDIDFALPWDSVKKLDYHEWKTKLYLNNLRKRHQKRMSKNKVFAKMKQSIALLKKRSNKKFISLNKKIVMSENKQAIALAEKLKWQKEDKNMQVSMFERSLKIHKKIKAADESQWKKDFKQKKTEWVKKLRTDAVLSESMYVMNDYINLINKHKKN